MGTSSLASVMLATLSLLAQVQVEPRGNSDGFYLGMRAVGASNRAAKALGVESPAGAVVTHVATNGPAETAGLRKGDLITRLGKYPVESLEDLVAAASFSPVNEPLRLTFSRGNRRFEGRLSMSGISHLTPPVSCAHPDGAYRLRVPITWQLEQPGEGGDGPFDSVASNERLYRVQLFRVSTAVSSHEQGLAEFARSHRRPGSTTVRATIAGVPAVWVAYPQGEAPRQVVYDIALSVGRRLYRIRSTAPILADPQQLPLPLQHFFSALTVKVEPVAKPIPEVVSPTPPPRPQAGPPGEPHVADARFRVPAAWQQLSANLEESKPCVLRFSMGSTSATFQVLRMDRPDDLLAWIVKEFQADLDDVDTVALAGSPAMRVEFSSEKRGVKGLLVASERRQSDKRAIAFLATAGAAEWARHQPSVEQVLKTIRFEPAQEQKP